VLEILSIIRGVKLPGLKERPEAPRSSGQLLDLQYAWRKQSSAKAKVSVQETLTHVMASATLSRAVLQLAAPVLGCDRFAGLPLPLCILTSLA